VTQFLFILAVAIVVALVAATFTGSVLARLGFPLPPSDRRIGALDGLRGYLSLLVLVNHFYIWTEYTKETGKWAKPSINILNQFGAASVALFFMTTGIVFYPRILTGLRKISWPTLYITRIFRIIPLVTASVAVITVIIIARTGARLNWQYPGSAALWISAWDEPDLLGYPETARMNAHVFWTLQCEWLFYLLVVPACALLMDLVRSRAWPSWIVPLTLFGVAGVGRVIAWLNGTSIPNLAYLSLFAIGMFAFECQARPGLRKFLSKPIMTVAITFALILGMTLSNEPYSKTLPFFAVFFIAIAAGNTLGGLLKTRGALVLGECSFGIYVLHGILLDIVFTDLAPLPASLSLREMPMLLPVMAIVAVLVTATTHLLIERPAIRLGKLLAARLSKKKVRLDSRELNIAP
jgi:peptidoglycan/LPS O-acetylase OafA/YrhL